MKNPIIVALSEVGIVFRTKDLNEIGITNYEIGKLVTEGLLDKIYQGLYSIDNLEKLEITDINVIIENGVVSLTSAAFHYKLTDSQSGKVTITLDRDQKPPKIPFDIFSYYYTTSKFYDIGLDIIDQNGRKIKIYDIERTVCDIVKHRLKYDSLLVKEVLENYLKREDKNIDKIIMYSKELRIYNVMKQYLNIIGGIDVKD